MMRVKKLFSILIVVGTFITLLYFIFLTNKLYKDYCRLSYYYILTKVTAEESDIIAKSQLLSDYIYQNVFQGDFQVKDLPAFDNLIRGIGWCDQEAGLFLTFIELLDVRGYLVFLKSRPDGSGESPHSIAIITPNTKEKLGYSQIAKEGIVVDSLQGVIYKNKNNQPATVFDICSRNILDSEANFFTKTLNYDLYCNKFQIFSSNTPLSLKSKKKQSYYLYIYPHLPEKIIFFYQDLVLNTYSRRLFKREDDFLYYKARNYHIYERFAKAEKLYNKIISGNADADMKAKCLFLEGMLFFRVGKSAAAKKNFAILIQEFPQSPWLPLAQEWIAKVEKSHPYLN